VRLDEHQAWRELFRRALALKPTPLSRTLKAARAFSSISQHEEALNALLPALRNSAQSPELHRALGEVYEAMDDRTRAIQAYSAVCALNPQDNAASARLSQLLNQRVPTWHFPMMNDTPRNEAFRAAIEARLTPTTRVLDIGCGAGLLSLMSARAGAAAVYACESEPQVAEVASEIITRNGYEEQIRLITKRSTQMSVGVDLPDRLDMLVCEIFDVSLLGEDALNTIRDAKERLLNPGAQIVPCGARVWCQLVESDELRARYHVETPEGFDLSPFNKLRDPRVLQLDLRRFGYTPLTEPILAASFDFEGDFELSGDHLLSAEVTRSGRADGFIFWYDLILDPSEEHVLSTSPHQEGTHWMQGFAPNYDEQRTLEQGEITSLICAYRRFLLWFKHL
jgi:tetratricopeptide (TPR) repeat protein